MFKIIYNSTGTTILEVAEQAQVDEWKDQYPNDIELVTIEEVTDGTNEETV